MAINGFVLKNFFRISSIYSRVGHSASFIGTSARAMFVNTFPIRTFGHISMLQSRLSSSIRPFITLQSTLVYPIASDHIYCLAYVAVY